MIVLSCACLGPTSTRADDDGLRNHLFELRSSTGMNESTDLKAIRVGKRAKLLSELDAHRDSSSLGARTDGSVAQLKSKCGMVVCAHEENSFRWDVPSLRVDNLYTPPHIIMIFVDDWGRNDMGSHSNSMPWATPHIDNLAENGIELTLHFLGWMCAPSRALLLTGRYTSKTGFWAKGNLQLSVNETTLAQELQSVGYRTRMVGKW